MSKNVVSSRFGFYENLRNKRAQFKMQGCREFDRQLQRTANLPDKHSGFDSLARGNQKYKNNVDYKTCGQSVSKRNKTVPTGVVHVERVLLLNKSTL